MSISVARRTGASFLLFAIPAWLLAVGGPTAAHAAPAAWIFQEVLAPGIPAPAPAGHTLDDFYVRDIDANGTIHFMARISGSPVTYGYYRLVDGTVLATRVPGDPAPAPVGGVYSAVLRDSDYASNGLVAFIGDVSGGSAASGVFTWAEGNDTNVAYEGQTAPGTGGGVFSAFREVEIDANGTVAFIAIVTGGSATWGVFRAAAGGPVEAVALQGQPAPVGGPFQDFYRLSLSDSGDVAFTATDGFELQLTRVVRVSGGVHTVVARASDPAPDLPGHTYYHEGTDQFPNFGALDLGQDGELAFTAALDDCRTLIYLGFYVPDVCAVFHEEGGTVHHVLGQHDDGVGRPQGIDVESGVGTLIATVYPHRVHLYDGEALIDVLMDPGVDPDDVWGLYAVDARLGPGGVVIALARPAVSGAAYSIWRGTPVTEAPLLAPPALALLATALTITALTRRRRHAPSRRTPAPMAPGQGAAKEWASD